MSSQSSTYGKTLLQVFFTHFASKNKLLDFSIIETLTGDGLHMNYLKQVGMMSQPIKIWMIPTITFDTSLLLYTINKTYGHQT